MDDCRYNWRARYQSRGSRLKVVVVFTPQARLRTPMPIFLIFQRPEAGCRREERANTLQKPYY
jgi:hypothetical protein